MNPVNSYMICEKCKSEFSRNNQPVTIPCGHNFCFTCISTIKKKNFVCDRDNIRQDLPESPSIDYLNLIEMVKSTSGLYKPIISVDLSKGPQIMQFAFNPNQVKKTKICSFYLRGICRYGQNCWNRHGNR